MLKFLFPTNNDAQLSAGIASGRCFALCCEWARLAISPSNSLIDNESKFDQELVNQAQVMYETTYQNEIKLMNELFNLSTTCHNISYSHAPTPDLAAKLLLDHLFSYPIHSVIIMGIKLSKGNSGLGHAMAFRQSTMILDTGQECFELFDPNQGVWQSTDQQLIRKKLRTILLQEYADFMPNSRIKNSGKGHTASFYAVNWTPQQPILSLEDEVIAVEQKQKESELALQAAPSNRMKHSLVVIQTLLTRTESDNLGIPGTRNKMAKLRYKEYLAIFQTFVELSSTEHRRKYQELFSTFTEKL